MSARSGTGLALALLLAGTATAGAQDESGTMIVFRDVSVVDVEAGTVLPAWTVIVEGRTIAWLGASAEAEFPEGATIVDGTGRFLVPGLADLHVHMNAADIPLFLANGVTTVREMNGSPVHLALRDSIAEGRIVGPRMLVTSPLLAGVPQRWRHEMVTNAAMARRLARESRERGYDALKVYDGLSAEVYAALAEASRTLGIPLVGHIPGAVGLEGVLAADQRSIEHVEQIAHATMDHEPNPDRVPEIVRGIAARMAEARTWVVPTLAAQRFLALRRTAAYDARLNAPEMSHVDPGILAWWETLESPAGESDPPPDDPRRVRQEAFYAFQRDLVRALHEAGVPLSVGTDTPNPLLVPGFSVHDELAALVDAGVPPADVLQMATVNAARFAGEAGRWGVVTPGAAADLLLVDGNPLKDLDALRRPSGVMVRGIWLDEDSLLGGRLFEDKGI